MNYETIHQLMKDVPFIQVLYGATAIMGGVARYLNGFVNGQRFKVSIFLASTFVAGFSGWMFAVLGLQMDLPQGIVFAMAGSGGFFGEQTMKLIYEYTKARVD